MIGIKNKKGVFFTILAIVIISLFALSYSFYSDTNKRESVQQRVETMNNFVFSVEEDISRNLFVAGFRTIFIVEQEDILEGNTVSNFTLVFNESFFEGTYRGAPHPLMDGATFSDIVDDLRTSAEKVNANVTIKNATVIASQDDPWNVKFTLRSNMIIEDVSNYVRWDKESVIEAYVLIKYFDDPIYIINTNGIYSSKMVQTPYDLSNGNVNNLTQHMLNSYYYPSAESPSFIDRLEGDFTNDNLYGVESIVDLEELEEIMKTNVDPNYNILSKSNIDHIYFTAENEAWCDVSSNPSRPIRLGEEHREIYNIECV